ncbi:MAG: hypothetical protein ACF8XB_00635 [Planctomycetota bacterium JB042]
MTLARRSFLALLLAGAALAAAPRAEAQCFGPDGLDFGACCAPAQLILPPFTQAGLPGLGICWDNCNVGTTNDLKLDWTPPAPSSLACGQFTSILSVYDGGTGAPLMGGAMHLDYTRTWEEVDPTGNLHQTWRFLVKVDLSPVAGTTGLGVCPVPTCIGTPGSHPTAFFYGYLDYSRECSASSLAYDNALVLFHGCDFMIHKPGLSDRPGTFHPGRSYAIVAPHDTVQPFVPGNLPHPSGTLVSEAMRKTGSVAGVAACFTEERISTGILANFGQGCFCPLSTLPPQYSVSLFEGKGSCPDATGQVSEFQSQFVFFPTLPWVHMVSASIGRWTSPAVYPGTEHVWANEGLFRTYDSCDAQGFFEVDYGATTTAGWTPILPIPVVLQTFTDMADNYTAPISGPHPFPIMGSVRPTDHLIYTNVP